MLNVYFERASRRLSSFIAHWARLPVNCVRSLWIVSLALTISFNAASQTIQSDKADYQPGDRVWITGNGWNGSEQVELFLTEIPKIHDDTTIYVNANEDGYFLVEVYHVEDHDINQSFVLTATGASGTTATAYFTDSAPPTLDKLEQLGNGPIGTPPITPTGWVTGNVVASKAHYTEDMVIPYRTEASNLVAGATYSITIGFDTYKSGKHAIDYLTTYDNPKFHSYFGHPQEFVNIDGGCSLSGHLHDYSGKCNPVSGDQLRTSYDRKSDGSCEQVIGWRHGTRSQHERCKNRVCRLTC
jgi:hypothetical protein